MTIADRLRVFMREHGLNRNQMADIISTPVASLDDWLSQTKPRVPPACMLTLMSLLEQSSQARRLAGVHKQDKAAPRGRPFKRGNPHRFKAQAPKE